MNRKSKSSPDYDIYVSNQTINYIIKPPTPIFNSYLENLKKKFKLNREKVYQFLRKRKRLIID